MTQKTFDNSGLYIKVFPEVDGDIIQPQYINIIINSDNSRTYKYYDRNKKLIETGNSGKSEYGISSIDYLHNSPQKSQSVAQVVDAAT